jgi:hypothetical protein
MSNVTGQGQPKRPKSGVARSFRRAFRGAQVALPLLTPAIITLGFLAVLDTGFDNFNHPLHKADPNNLTHLLYDYRAVPIYVFLSLGLLVFQAVLWEKHSVGHILFVLGMGLLAIVFAGVYLFSPDPPDIIKNPLIYYVTNALFYAVFLVDAFRRHRASTGGGQSPAAATVLGGTDGGGPSRVPQRRLFDFMALLAADCIGFGILAGAFALTLSQLEDQIPALQFVYKAEPGLGTGHPGRSGISRAPSTFAALKIDDLVQADKLLAFAAGFGAVFCIVSVFWLMGDERQTPGQTGRILREAFTQIKHTLRPLGLFFWLGASFVSGLLAQGLEVYYVELASKDQPAKGMHVTMADLFNPFDGTFPHLFLRNFFPQDLLALAIGIVIAVACVIVAAVVTETDVNIVERTIATFASAGQRLAISLALFLLGLSFVNAIALILDSSTPKPFQFSAAGLIGVVLAALVFAGYVAAGQRQK